MSHIPPRMPRVMPAALLALALVGPAGSIPTFAADDARKIAWREDFALAQAEAKSRDLLLWIQFTGPWCINCRRMDRSTFVDPLVVDSSRDRFIPVKLRSDEYENLTQSLGLTTLPATVIVRPNGEVVEKVEGFNDAERFDVFLTGVLRREGRSPEQIAAKVKAKAAKDAAVALAGYDPVTLIQDQKLVRGKPDLTVEHEGRVFRFASEAGRVAFLEKPGSFAPVNGGRCPVSQVDRGDFLSGDPRWGVVYSGHLFLFKDESERNRFVKDPERYAHVDAAGRGSCPHCWSRTRLAGRPSSRFSATNPIEGRSTIALGRLDSLLTPTGLIRR